MNALNFQFLLFLLLSTFTTSAIANTCAMTLNDEQEAKAKQVKTVKYWANFQARPIELRYQPAPQELVDFINLDNRKNGWPCSVVSASLTESLGNNLSTAISTIPSQVRKLISEKVIGIFLVKNLGGTGYTDIVYSESGHPSAGFIVIDPEAIGKKSANEWLTWKENTPFAADDSSRISAIIEKGSQNNIANAFQFILLHEFGHVLSIGSSYVPLWDTTYSNSQHTRAFQFSAFSWGAPDEKGKFSNLFEAALPETKQLTYYFGPKNKTSEIAYIYRKLQSTNFPTLYSATSPYDDFADSFASYIHSVVMNKPYQIQVIHNEKVVHKITSCWNAPRCRDKKAFFEALLKPYQ